MTTPSSDSLLPSPPDRSEAEARNERAREAARQYRSAVNQLDGTAYIASRAMISALDDIISILDGGQS